MKKIPLRNKAKKIIAFAIVDDDIYEKTKQHRWYLSSHGYAKRNICKNGKYKNKMLHHVVAGKPSKKMECDHINRIKLDNRKSNLRIVTRSINRQNCSIINNTSGYRGVSWNNKEKKWNCQITINKKQTHLGWFKNKHIAAKVYDTKMTEVMGKKALTNKKMCKIAYEGAKL